MLILLLVSRGSTKVHFWPDTKLELHKKEPKKLELQKKEPSKLELHKLEPITKKNFITNISYKF